MSFISLIGRVGPNPSFSFEDLCYVVGLAVFGLPSNYNKHGPYRSEVAFTMKALCCHCGVYSNECQRRVHSRNFLSEV